LLKENLKKQITVLDEMIQAFKGLEGSVVSKNLEQISQYAVTIEEKSLELLKIEEEREKILNEYKVKTVREYLEKDDTPEKPEIAFLSAEIVEKLNELTIVMDGIRQIIEFENQYAGLLNNLIKGVQAPTYNFSKNSQSSQEKNYAKNYTQMESQSRYDKLK